MLDSELGKEGTERVALCMMCAYVCARVCAPVYWVSERLVILKCSWKGGTRVSQEVRRWWPSMSRLVEIQDLENVWLMV